MYQFLVLCIVALIAFPAIADTGALRPAALRVEYRRNPQGIGDRQPRFLWRVESSERNQLQRAYQLLVSDEPAQLDADTGNLWDTGKVVSDETTHIVYEGAALNPRTRYWWKVRSWDTGDRPSEWSEIAQFSTGLFFDDDGEDAFVTQCAPRFIGFDAGHKAAYVVEADVATYPDVNALDYDAAGIRSLDAASWIWHPEGEPRQEAPAAARYFRRVVTLPEDARIVNAQLYITADDAAHLWINGRRVGVGRPDMRNWRQAYHFLVASFLYPGDNVLAVRAENKEAAAGLVAALRITLADGAVIDCVTDDTWKSSAVEPDESWRHAGYNDSDWRNARALAAFGEAPWTDVDVPVACLEPVPYLRTAFGVRDDIARATIYATALGIYELRLNGNRVGNNYFAPGWTDYRKRLYYHCYDVTDMIRPGADNALGAILANGWYAGHIGLKGPELYGTRPRMQALLHITYADGSEECIGTDGSWRAAFGEIRGTDMLMGETRDKQQALNGWDLPDYDDSAWRPVTVGAEEITPERIQAHPGVPVKQFEELPARSVTEVRPGVFVYDIGQNMVGWVRITVDGVPGQMVRVRHAEMLQDDGMLYTEALRSALATNVYRLSESGDQTLEPTFTFHGFRYVELRGVDTAPPPEAVVGIVLHSDVPITIEFDSSEPLLNQLVHNITWGLKGNYLEIPTDCPQRDERLGWTGDAQFFMPTALYTADIGAFFTKWLVDLVQDAQLDDGSFAHVAPDVGLGGGAVGWGDAAIICPWLFYRFYGDIHILEQHFDNMMRGMDFLERTSRNYIRRRLGFGDWLNLGGGAKDEVICTAYYAHLAEIMAGTAALIGREDDAERYAQLYQHIRNAFVENFIDDEGRILESSQTGYALAFAFDLIPETLREAAAARYVEEIARFDWHLATGFIGTPRLLPTLTQAGRDDVAWRLLMNTTYPSWLFQVTLGATTMWERWNGWTPDEGFADPNMNSFNHYAFGAVGEWIFSRVAGINHEAPGFRRIRIAPMPGGRLTHAHLTYHSIRGPIVSAWRIADGRITLEVEAPANTTATVVIPTADPASVTEGGRNLEAGGIAVIARDEESLSCTVGSGRYVFQAKAPKAHW